MKSREFLELFVSKTHNIFYQLRALVTAVAFSLLHRMQICALQLTNIVL